MSDWLASPKMIDDWIEGNDEPTLYWMNCDTGRVIASETCPGSLWSEIDFETYDALTHPGARPNNGLQPTPTGGHLGEA